MTLTPNFLPVGSIVERNGIPCTVQIVSNDSISTNLSSGFLNEFNGIKLTPEILTEWCGFHKVEENQYRLGFKLLVNRDGKWFDYGSNVQLDYLHELQLLFIAHKTVLPITIK